MKISVVTIFPKIFDSFTKFGIVQRAIKKGALDIEIINLRQFAKDKHKTVDDKPYAGGSGMILRVDIAQLAIEEIKKKSLEKPKIIYLSPQGKIFNQQIAKKLAKEKHLIFICGHYEGVDTRIENFIDLEISIGNYILSGGETAAMVTIDSVLRLLPNVVSKKDSITSESLEKGLLKYPQYTKPRTFKKLKVPPILLSGDHQKIKKWRQEKALKITLKKRPDLMKLHG